VVDIAILDACVLYPAPLRDILLELAVSDLFQAKWTDQIHDEWRSNLLKNRPDLTWQQLDRTQGLMNVAVPDGLVTRYKRLISRLSLPDPNDRHVLAAAIQAKASQIITFNLKDFPELTLAEYQLTAIHPDAFLIRLFNRNPDLVIGGLRRCRDRLQRPQLSTSRYLSVLEAQSLHAFVEKIQNQPQSI
jgi:predicted nucleic acid-binding protein